MESGFTTETFVVPASAYARMMMGDMLRRYWWIPALILLASIVGATYDLRYLFVGLIVTFNLLPFALFNIYFGKLLTRQAQDCARPKRLSINEGESITVEYPTEGEEAQPMDPRTILWSDIRQARFCGSNLAVICSDGFLLMIPDALLPRQCVASLLNIDTKEYIFEE